MRLVDSMHDGYVRSRRVRVLADRLADLLPPGARVLDVGCGDGALARTIGGRRPDVKIDGVEVLVRGGAEIPVLAFDGRRLPHGDASFDVVMYVDVLHHAEDALALLREGARVSRRALIIKDHTREGFLAGPTLRFMDRVGNERHGVASPGNYWTLDAWRRAFADLGLEATVFERRLGLYPAPADWVFGRRLHFVARLERPA